MGASHSHRAHPPTPPGNPETGACPHVTKVGEMPVEVLQKALRAMRSFNVKSGWLHRGPKAEEASMNQKTMIAYELSCIGLAATGRAFAFYRDAVVLKGGIGSTALLVTVGAPNDGRFAFDHLYAAPVSVTYINPNANDRLPNTSR